MFNLLNKPIYDDFFELIEESTHSIKLCAPYIKNDIVEEIYKRKNTSTNISIITKINLMSFLKKSSDIEALSTILINHDLLYNLQNLHAKIYIFDDSKSIITSANLTVSGMKRNYEYGVYIDDPNIISNICNDFKALCSSELTGCINSQHINKIEDILSGIPEQPKLDIPKFNIDIEPTDEIFTEDINFIRDKLTGWKKDIFHILDHINSEQFNLSEVYHFKEHLHIKHPGNNNIEAKIRQQLQQLRDIGLIKFEEPGVYRKLWR